MKTRCLRFGRGLICAGMLLVVAVETQANERYWVGSGNWSATANWAETSGGEGGATAPGVGDTAIFDDSGTGNATVDASFAGTVGAVDIREGYTGTITQNRDFTVKNDFVISNGLWRFTAGTAAELTVDGDMIVASAIQCQRTSTAGQGTGRTFTVGGDMTIESNGWFNADGLGFGAGGGPGPGSSHGGGGHGGRGGFENTTGSGITYGSIAAPLALGSGGTSQAGGGAIRLDVAGSMTLDGAITVNGTGGSTGCGAGGSVFITTGSLTGSGTVYANGGDDTSSRGGGGGGRIAVILTSGDSTGSVAMQAIGGDSGWVTRRGAAGTVYIRNAGETQGSLMIDNADRVSTGAATTHFHAGIAIPAFDDVTIRRSAILRLDSDSILTVYGSWSNAATFTASGTIEFAGTNTATIYNNNSFANLVSTNAGKAIRFEAGKTQTITNGITLSGAASNPLVLESSAPGSPWHINQNVVHDVRYVEVSDSNAGGGAPMLALNSSNVANNVNWIFTEVGDIVWTGGAGSTTWTATNNWNLGRAPLPDDTSINIGPAEYQPELDINREFNGRLTIEAGAMLTLNGRNLAINGAVTNAGTLTATGSEILTCRADVDFTGGILYPAQSTLVLDGATAQTFKPDGNTFYDINIPTTNQVTVTDNFSVRNLAFSGNDAQAVYNGTVTATNITCHVTGRTGLTFDKTITVIEAFSVTGQAAALNFNAALTAGLFAVACTTATNNFSSGIMVDTFRSLNSGGGLLTFGAGTDFKSRILALRGGATTNLLLRSASPGAAWNLNVSGFTSVRLVDAQDSNASGGEKVYAISSAGVDANNSNWDFGSGKAWIGSTTVWATAINWTPTGAPESAHYVVIDGDGTMQPDLNLVGGPVSVSNLVIGASTTSTLTFSNGDVSDKKLAVIGNVLIGANGTLTHAAGNVHSLFLDMGGNLTVDAGGKIDVSGRGYARQTGPGVPSPAGSHAGAAHGGMGGRESATPNVYGSIRIPVTHGSGGGNTSGGGVIRLEIAGALSNNGAILANGVNGTEGCGAGGSILIRAATLDGIGVIAAIGGNDTSGRGSGGGGRIAVTLTNGAIAGASNISAAGGGPGTPGAAGTVYLLDSSDILGRMLVGNPYNTTTYAWGSAETKVNAVVTDTEVGHVFLRNQAKFSISENQTLIVYGSWSNAATFTAGGTVEFAGSAPATVWNDNAWGNLTIATRGKIVRFEAGKTQTVNGTPVFDNGVTLLSTVDGTQWLLRKDGDGIQEVGRVSVRDSHAGTWGEHLRFQATGGVDMGNNVNWGEWPPLPTVIMLR